MPARAAGARAARRRRRARRLAHRARAAAGCQLRVPQRGDKRSLLETVARNAGEALAQHKLQAGRRPDHPQQGAGRDRRGARHGAPRRCASSASTCPRSRAPTWCASMVVFEDGLARKSEYRRFVGATAARPTTCPRCPRCCAGGSPATSTPRPSRRGRRPPGEPTTPTTGDRSRASTRRPAGRASSRTRRSWSSSTAAQPQVQRRRRRCWPSWASPTSALCGLAKRLEEVWLPGDEFPVILPRTSEGLYLLQRVRDEAHRFAITFHRQRRSKRMTASALDNVPGLGEVRRKALLRHFGSLKRLAAATVEEIAEVPGHRPAHRRGDPRRARRAGDRRRRAERGRPASRPRRPDRRPASRGRTPAAMGRTPAEPATPAGRGRTPSGAGGRSEPAARLRAAGSESAPATATERRVERWRDAWRQSGLPGRWRGLTRRNADAGGVALRRLGARGDGARTGVVTPRPPWTSTGSRVRHWPTDAGVERCGGDLEQRSGAETDLRGRDRRVRRRPQHGGPRPGERRLLRGGQPAAGADAGHGRAGVPGRRRGPAYRDGAGRAQPGLLHRPGRRGAGAARARLLAPGGVRRRRRRGADPPVRERPPLAPVAGRRPARRRHRRRARAARARPASRPT